MTVGHPLRAPAPRGAGPTPAPPASPARPVDARVRRAADALITAVAGSPDHPTTTPACAGEPGCARPGILTVVTEHDATPLCEMHAMTAVFIASGRLAVVKTRD